VLQSNVWVLLALKHFLQVNPTFLHKKVFYYTHDKIENEKI
jgi:hypothetical protein